MQWLIDIVYDLCKDYIDALFATFNSVPSGTICMWSGVIADIPDGWQKCSGDNGTPDLRDKFIIAHGPLYDRHTTGGTTNHNHSMPGTHTHPIGAGGYIQSGTGYDNYTDSPKKMENTDNSDHIPPYYSLVFIMKL